VARQRIPAVFVRGGSSKGVVFHARHLPHEASDRDRILLAVLGSPDPFGRQLNGMGGGISSLSKAAIVSPSSRDDADVDYTFAQVAVDRPVVDYGSNCGNLASAIGPFAIDEGLVSVQGPEALVRIFNTNTSKIIHARFDVKDGQAAETGEFVIPGVAGGGARIRLDFLNPGGAATKAFLPSGLVMDQLEIPGVGRLHVTLADATNPVVFVDARVLGLTLVESPEQIDANEGLMRTLDAIRRAGGVKMGLGATSESVSLANPKVALVAPATDFRAIDGSTVAAAEYDVAIRIVSMEKTHKAVTLTGAMCLAAACKVTGSIPHSLARPSTDVRIGNPSGVLPVGAVVEQTASGWEARHATVYRTARRLMEGFVVLP